MLKRLSPYLLLSGLGLLYFGKLVLQPSGVLYSPYSDLLASFLPARCFLVRSWQETGALPLWCPYWFSGMTFIHNLQIGAFYPLHAPLYVLPQAWIAPAQSWLLVAHVVIAGWCMLAYTQKHGLGGVGALVAAIGYMFAGKWLLNILVAGQFVMAPLAWMPLVLILFEGALERGSLIRGMWAGAVFSLIVLATHPQLTFYAGVFAAVWTLGPVFERLPGELTRRRFLLRWLTCGLCTAATALALCAVQLLPMVDAARLATRGGGVAAADLAIVFWAAFYGLVGPGWSAGWEELSGLGLLWVGTALLAPLLCRGRPRFEAAVALAILLFSLGGACFLQWLPGFGLFQIPIRMSMLLALPLALSAGRTTQILLVEFRGDRTQAARARGVIVRVLIAGMILGACGAWVAYSSRSRQLSVTSPVAWLDELGMRHWLYWLGLLVTAPAMLWLLSERCGLPRRIWQFVWVAVLLADLWSLTWPNVEVRAPSSVYPISEGVEFLAARRRANPQDHWRVFDRGVPGCPSTAPLGAALPFLQQVELEPVLGYDPLDVHRYKEYLQFIEDEDQPIAPNQGIFGFPIIQPFPIRNKKLLDLLGTRFAFQFVDENLCFRAAGEPGQNPEWEKLPLEDRSAQAYSFLAGGMQPIPAYTIYENREAFPRAFTLSWAKPLADRRNVLDQLKSTDFRRVVLLEGSSADGGAIVHGNDEDFRPAELSLYSPDRIEIDTERAEAGYLVLCDVWYPGWKCKIDNRPTDIFRANFLFRAIALPAGKHQVVFTFEPASYSFGKLISGAALLLLAAASLAWGVKALRTSGTIRHKSS